MTYSTVSDIRREFKSLLDAGNVITNDKIIEFQSQMYAMINSIVGIRYAIPVTGTSPVNRTDTVTASAAAGSGEIFTLTIVQNGLTTTHTYTSSGVESAETVRDGLLAVINADANRLVDATASGTDDFIIEGRVLGFDYTPSVTGNLSLSAGTTAVFGSMGLRLLRKIEAELTACKIAAILRTKVAEKLKESGVRQDIKDGSCESALLKQLRSIADGKVNLDDADQSTSGTGLESHNQKTGYEGQFKVGVRQW